MTVPCETCGKPTRYEATKRCDNCYEVESRLPEYLRSVGGRYHVRKLLAAASVARRKKQ